MECLCARHWFGNLIQSSNSSQRITWVVFHPVIISSASQQLSAHMNPLCKLETGTPSPMCFTSICQKTVMLSLLEQYLHYCLLRHCQNIQIDNVSEMNSSSLDVSACYTCAVHNLHNGMWQLFSPHFLLLNLTEISQIFLGKIFSNLYKRGREFFFGEDDINSVRSQENKSVTSFCKVNFLCHFSEADTISL